MLKHTTMKYWTFQARKKSCMSFTIFSYITWHAGRVLNRRQVRENAVVNPYNSHRLCWTHGKIPGYKMIIFKAGGLIHLVAWRNTSSIIFFISISCCTNQRYLHIYNLLLWTLYSEATHARKDVCVFLIQKPSVLETKEHANISLQ